MNPTALLCVMMWLPIFNALKMASIPLVIKVCIFRTGLFRYAQRDLPFLSFMFYFSY